MKFIKFAALAAALAFGTAVADEVEKKVELKVIKSVDGSDTASEVHWVSNDPDLENLAVGESRVIEGDSGTQAIVTRTEEGLSFDIDGETVVIPDMEMGSEHVAFVHAGGDMDVDVEVIDDRNVRGVTIISGKELDNSVKESIRSVLISAGHDEEVKFLDGGNGEKRVKVIKRKIEKTM